MLVKIKFTKNESNFLDKNHLHTLASYKKLKSEFDVKEFVRALANSELLSL